MILYTSKRMAEYLDVTERRVRQLRDEEVIRENRPGLYEPMDTMKRYIRYLHSNGNGLNDERAKLLGVKREKAEIELEEIKGGLHRTEDIERALTTMLMNFRTRIMAIPAKLAGNIVKMTDQNDVFDALKKETDEALEELSHYDEAFAAEEKDSDDQE